MENNNTEMSSLVKELISDKGGNAHQKQCQEEVTGLLGENQGHQGEVKELIQKMSLDIEEAKKVDKDEPETRVKQTVYRTIAGKFRDVLRQSQQIQSDYKATVQGKIKRQLKIAKKDATEEELDELARNPEQAQQVLQEQVVGQRVGVHSKIKNTVDDIQNKYKDIMRLEQNVNELFELFQELAVLIRAQGEMLDSIEANLDDANDYMEKAEQQLQNAQEMHKKNRSKVCCFLMCFATIVVALSCWLFGFPFSIG